MDSLFGRLCEAMGQPELAKDPRYVTHKVRGDNAAELDGRIAEWSKTLTAEELDKLLDDHGVVVGPIYTMADIVNDPQFQARDMIRNVEDEFFGEIAVPGFVPKLSDSESEIAWLGPPEPGLHNREVYGELLGLSDDDLTELEQEGII